MGKQRAKSKKVRKNNHSNPSNFIKKDKINQARLKRKKLQQQNQSSPLEDKEPILLVSDHGADEVEKPAPEVPEVPEDPEDVKLLLEPYTKDQLINLLADAVADDPSLLSYIRSVAEHDIAHRKIFIRGIGWDVTTESLLAAFRPYGPVLDCNLIIDRASGRNKGYGFIVFSTRSGAVKALKAPDKKIGTRIASCQLASIGNVVPASSSTDISQRRVYVSNVHADVSPEKLKFFFATFGEIESGPSGFDMLTGKSRGFAIFVYKTQDGAARALQEPYKMFEGHKLHCKLALDHSQKGKFLATPAPQSLPVVNQQPALNAVAEAQKVAMLSQNPAYNMLFVQNQLLTNAALNPNSFAAYSPAALTAFNSTSNFVTPQGQVYGGLGYGSQSYGGHGHGGVGIGLGGYDVFGTYRTQENAGLSYGGSQLGQSSSATPASGFLRGFP